MTAHILIIEDNKENCHLMSYLLTMHGYQVLQATDGERGLLLSKCEPCDLIICDIQLPKIDGFEVIKRLKANSCPQQNIPLVAITAYAMVGDREKILTAGADGYISKPIDPESFVSEIEAFLPINKRAACIELAHFEDQEHANVIHENYRGTILVVDDNPTDRYLSEMLLKSIGFETISANCIDEAIEILETNQPDMILSDYHLQEYNTLELLQRQKNKLDLNKIPFILISSSIQSEQNAELMMKTDDIEDIIIRPLEPQSFIEIIERVWKERCSANHRLRSQSTG